jgi:hypothetical protein
MLDVFDVCADILHEQVIIHWFRKATHSRCYILFIHLYIYLWLWYSITKKNIHYNVLFILKQTFNSESKLIYFNVNFKFEDLYFYLGYTLRYLCLFAYSGVQYILCCVFVLFFFILCTLCFQILWIANFWLPLRYSLKIFLLYIIRVRIIGIYHNVRPFFSYIGTTEQL